MPPPPPLPLDRRLLSGTAHARRRNSYSYSVSGADSSGVRNNNKHSYFGGGGAINDSVAVASSTHRNQNRRSSYHHGTLQPSPLCARAVLHQESTSGAGEGGGSGILPLPFALTNDNKSGKTYPKSARSASNSNRNTASTSSAPRSSSRSRAVVTTSRDHGVVERNYHHGDNEDNVGTYRTVKSSPSYRSSRGSFTESNDAGGECGKNRKGGETKEQPDKVEGGPAIKRELSRRKSQEFNSISGSREAIRLFSRTNSLPVRTMRRQDDGDDAKKPSWKDSVGSSSPEKSDSLMNRFGSKISGKTNYLSSSRSRSPSPRKMREFGGAMRRRSPPRGNNSRAIRSQSCPRERRPNDQYLMKRQSSVPRGPSFSSGDHSPKPRGGRTKMSAQGNQYQNRCKSGTNPNHRPPKRIELKSRYDTDGWGTQTSYADDALHTCLLLAAALPPRNGRHRRGSSSPPLNRSFSRHERVERRNSDFVLRTRGAPVGITRGTPALQRSGSFENRRCIMPATTSFAPTRSISPPRMRPQSQQRRNSDGYTRHVGRKHAVESQAFGVRNQLPSTVYVSMASPRALVPGVESRSSLHEPGKRRSSASTESTGTGGWIDCPKQHYDPCDDDLTSSECHGTRGEDSSTTHDATQGIPPQGPPSPPVPVAHAFATNEVPDGPPTASGRQVDLQKCTKPHHNDQCSNQTRSKVADLAMLSKIVEDVITMRSQHTARFAEDKASSPQLVEQGIVRKASTGSLLSLNKKQSSSFVPGPPPKKSANSSFALAPESPRPRPTTPPEPELVLHNTLSVRNVVAKNESNFPVNHQSSPAPDNGPPYRRQPSPPLPPPPHQSSNNSPIETHQPFISNSFQDTLQVSPAGSNWRQYLTRGNRNTSNSSGRDTSRGRASGNGRSGSRERMNKKCGQAPEKLDDNDRQVNNVVTDMPFRDHFGDYGIYKGQVNKQGQPNGKGSMKYDNGIFYEGMWVDGCQDENSASQYHRIRSGFTSWKGKGTANVKSGKTLPWNVNKIDKHDQNDKIYVRGMEWVDLNGDSGRYTGEVNREEIPHGKGIMKYDIGLIAEGEWVNGMLKENPLDRMIRAAAMTSSGQGASAMSVMSGACSVVLGGGMSVGPGMSGGMSVGPMSPPTIFVGGIPQGSVYGGMPQLIQPQQMMPQQMMMMTHQHQPNNTAQLQQQAALIDQQMP